MVCCEGVSGVCVVVVSGCLAGTVLVGVACLFIFGALLYCCCGMMVRSFRLMLISCYLPSCVARGVFARFHLVCERLRYFLLC